MAKPISPTEAFENYCRNPLIQKALEMAGNNSLTHDLLKDCFMAGAGYAIQRCKEEHHQPKKAVH